jgi:hypothetical protein
MKSFDMHIHEDRAGQVRMSVTLPNGRRTTPTVLTRSECKALEWLVGWVSQDAFLEAGISEARREEPA